MIFYWCSFIGPPIKSVGCRIGSYFIVAFVNLLMIYCAELI